MWVRRHVKRHLTRVDEGIFGDCRGNCLLLIRCYWLRTRGGGRGWETQQTSGITKTKLKFFIVNKREGRARWIWCRSYLLIWSHCKLSFLLPLLTLVLFLEGEFEIFASFDQNALTTSKAASSDPIWSCAHPQNFSLSVLVCYCLLMKKQRFRLRGTCEGIATQINRFLEKIGELIRL